MFQPANDNTVSISALGIKRALAVSRWLVLLAVLLSGTVSKVSAQDPGLSTRQQAHLFVTADRRVLAKTSQFPFSAIVKLDVTFPDGARGWGTGALIGPNKIVTAEHVVFSERHGGHASIRVLPGYDNGSTICHETTVASFVHGAHQGCHSGAKCDVAVLTTQDSIGCNTGWFGFKQFDDANLSDVFIAGYPEDLNDGEKLNFVHTSATHAYSSYHNILEYSEWTAEGMSGGPIFTPDFYVVGIHTNGGSTANSGVGLCNQLAGWLTYSIHR